MPDYIPLEPPQITKPKPPVELTNEEDDKRKQMLVHYSSSDYKVETDVNGELTEEEKFWLSNECILRYLRGSKWNVQTAIKRLDTTLKWRREYGLYDRITADHVSVEGETGKEIIFGYDVDHRPALFLFPSRQNTDTLQGQLEFMVFFLERCCDLMGPGIETIVLMVDFADRAKQPSFNQSRSALNIIQDHYPERLGLALIANIPYFVQLFFKMITPFIDPVTRQKLKFNPRVFEDGFMTKDNVLKEWNGDRELIYEHDKYWPALIEMCQKRKSEFMERWRQLGAKVGISEWDYKNGPALPNDINEATPADVEVNANFDGKVEAESTVIDISQQTVAA